MFNTCANSCHHCRHPYQEVPDPKSNILLPLLRTGLPPSSWAKAYLTSDPCLPSTHLRCEALSPRDSVPVFSHVLLVGPGLDKLSRMEAKKRMEANITSMERPYLPTPPFRDYLSPFLLYFPLLTLGSCHSITHFFNCCLLLRLECNLSGGRDFVLSSQCLRHLEQWLAYSKCSVNTSLVDRILYLNAYSKADASSALSSANIIHPLIH